jgi:hypothetical protein
LTQGSGSMSKGLFPKTNGLSLRIKGLFPKTNGLSLGSKPLRLESETVFVESERPVPKRSALSKRTADRSAVNLIASIWLSAHGAISFARGRRFFERRSGTRLGRPRISIILGRLSDAPPISTRRQPELAAEGHAEKRGVREATQRDPWAPRAQILRSRARRDRSGAHQPAECLADGRGLVRRWAVRNSGGCPTAPSGSPDAFDGAPVRGATLKTCAVLPLSCCS